MARHLGPLEQVGNRWVIGDPSLPDSLYILLTPDGLEHRNHAEGAPLLTVEWSRLLDLKVRAAYRRWQAAKGAGLLAGAQPGVDVGPDGCSLRGFMRGAFEPLSIRYTHHSRRYTGGHVIVLKALFKRLSDERALHRLGDFPWLEAVVTELSSHRSWMELKGRRRVKELIQSIGA